MGEFDYASILKDIAKEEQARGSYERIETLKAIKGKSNPELLQRAVGALKGVAMAEHDLSVSFDLGDGVAKNDELAFYWSKLAAEGGDSMAQNNLANKYSRGVGTVFNGKKAIEWYRKSCAQGQPEAMGNLAFCYLCGQCIERNPTEAIRLINESIARGEDNGRNYYNLATCYENGDGVEADIEKAVELYRKSGELGYKKARAALRRLRRV